jgi:hypothetical protein
MNKLYLFLVIFTILLIVVYSIALYKDMNKIHIYTITNTLDKWEINALRESVKRNGGDLNIIFTNDKIGRLPIGFGPKVIRLYEEIKNRRNSDMICFVDAFDVLFLSRIEELKQKYLAMNLGDKVLFSAEKSSSCWPVTDEYKNYCESYEKMGKKPKEGDYGYLNSGMFIGTVKGIKGIIEERWNEVRQEIDDQGFYGMSYLYTDRIVLDVKCEIFQNLIGEQFDDLVWKEDVKRWYNKHTNTYPVVAQGNGDSRDKLFKVIMPKLI